MRVTFQIIVCGTLAFHANNTNVFHFRLPSPNQENIGDSQVNTKFPAEHPYSSHSSRFSLFPAFDTPTDMKRGEEKHLYQPTLPPETPAAAPESKIIGKSRGTPARREEVPVSRSSERSPLKWLDGPNFYQVVFCCLLRKVLQKL